MAKFTSETVLMLLREGGSFEINCSPYTSDTAEKLIRALQPEASLKLTHLSAYTSPTVLKLVKAAAGKAVVFVLD